MAIDRLLTADELNEPQAVSTRTDITPVSFINTYNWGSLKGRPNELMQQYFEPHVHVPHVSLEAKEFQQRLKKYIKDHLQPVSIAENGKADTAIGT